MGAAGLPWERPGHGQAASALQDVPRWLPSRRCCPAGPHRPAGSWPVRWCRSDLRPTPRQVARRVRTDGPLPNHPADVPGSDQADHPTTIGQGEAQPALGQTPRRPVRRHEGHRSLTQDDPEPPRQHLLCPAPSGPLGLGQDPTWQNEPSRHGSLSAVSRLRRLTSSGM